MKKRAQGWIGVWAMAYWSNRAFMGTLSFNLLAPAAGVAPFWA